MTDHLARAALADPPRAIARLNRLDILFGAMILQFLLVTALVAAVETPQSEAVLGPVSGSQTGGPQEPQFPPRDRPHVAPGSAPRSRPDIDTQHSRARADATAPPE